MRIFWEPERQTLLILALRKLKYGNWIDMNGISKPRIYILAAVLSDVVISEDLNLRCNGFAAGSLSGKTRRISLNLRVRIRA